ncbi:DUF177 domain-containing protein [soil metagenome]
MSKNDAGDLPAVNLPLEVMPFCVRMQHAQFEFDAGQLPRLAGELAGRRLAVTIDGSIVPRQILPEYAGKPMLSLRVQGTVAVTCVRCLTPVDVPLDLTSRFVVFETDAEADEALVEDELHDAVAGLPRLDPRPLVEDEVFMAIPDPVHHDVCPPEALADLGLQPAGDGVVIREDAVPSPFAALAVLKKH